MKSKEVVVSLEALAQESRLAIFRLLIKSGADGCSPGQIADALKVPGPTLSFHLSQLKHAGLINCRRNGRSLIYSANFDRMNGLVSFLTENCCGADAPRVPVCVPANTKRREARK